MSSLEARIDKIYSGTISDVTSTITIKKDKKIIKRKSYGTNQQKVIEIVVQL